MNGNTLKDRIKNESIQGNLEVVQEEDKKKDSSKMV